MRGKEGGREGVRGKGGSEREGGREGGGERGGREGVRGREGGKEEDIVHYHSFC